MAYSDQHFEDELREKLSKDAPLPQGMEWQAMRQGINQKVQAARKKKKTLAGWWWPGIGILLLLLAGTIGYQLRSAHSSSSEAVVTGESSATDQPSTTESAAGTTKMTQAAAASVRTTSPPVKARAQPETTALTTSPQPEADIALRPTLPDNSVPASTVASGPEATFRSASDRPATLRAPTVARALALLPFRNYVFVAEGNLRPFPQLEVSLPEREQEGRQEELQDSISGKRGWFIDVLAGTQFASANYQGSDAAYATRRSETETPLPGHHLSIGMGKSIGSKWQLRTGLSYDRVRTLTDYVSNRTFDSTFVDFPVRVLNGDTIYGAAELEVRETRELRSFQREQRLTVPLTVGRQIRLGRNWLALRAGPEFGLLIGSGGKVLAPDGGTRTLSDADFQKISISARLEGELLVPLGTKGPLLVGQIGLRRVLSNGPSSEQRRRNSVIGGIGLRVPL